MSAPPRERLSRERVLSAAVQLADREGAEALTVRRLADDLRVHPTSLYNHVPSKGAILDGVVERMFAEVADLWAPMSWQEWLRTFAYGFRDLARAHPGAFMVLARRPAQTAAAYDLAELGLDAFRRGGFSPLRSVQAVRAVSLAVLGMALNECPPRGEWVAPGPADLSIEGRPRMREAAELGIEDGAGHWELMIEVLVSGLGTAADEGPESRTGGR